MLVEPCGCGKSIEVFFMVMSVGQDVGSYRLVAEVSHGEYAIVYQAVHRILSSRVVALKLLYTARLHDEDDQEDFFREARILAELQHPYILPLVDVNIYEGLPYIMTEFATHGSLRHKLNHQPGSPLAVDEALMVLKQVGEALYFAHQHNVVHCDVKPENILFRANNEAVMADFDIARVLGRTNAAVRSLGGTSAYMAPEQFQGKVRKESDQYALGCIAYELLTGKRPFHGEDQTALMHAHLYEKPMAPSQVNARLSADVDEVILKAMAKKYAERYKDVLSFLEALGAAVETRRPHAGPPLVLNGAAEARRSHVRPALVLKGAAESSEKDSEIYYEKTELSAPEDEKTGASAGHAATAARKRRTTKATTGEKVAAPRQARTTVKAEGVRKAVGKKEAEPAGTKKPVKRSAGSTKAKQAMPETREAGIQASDKKVLSRRRAAATVKKKSVSEGAVEASQVKTVAARRVSTAKKTDGTSAKSPAAKKRTGSGEKSATAGDEHAVRRSRKASN